jgi:hypothetical protein
MNELNRDVGEAKEIINQHFPEVVAFCNSAITPEKIAVLAGRLQKEFPNLTIEDTELVRKRSIEIMVELLQGEILEHFGAEKGADILAKMCAAGES